MNHPTDDELAEYAFDPESAANAEEIESHVAACPRCSSSLTFIRSVDLGFKDADAWDIADGELTPTREAVRDLAARLAAEDEEAKELLRDFIANPARIALANFSSRRKFLTAGVARRLLSSASEACDREPLDALTFADAAIDVSKNLIGYPSAMVHELRAYALKERANALVRLGQFGLALDALDRADREFAQAPGVPVGHAIVQHARAWVHYSKGEFDPAAALLAESAATYASLGETDRYMRARHVVANMILIQGRVREAEGIYQELLAWGEAENDLAWIARESNTLGRCAYELRDLSAAVQHFHRSLQAFRELGMDAESIRPEWGFALVVLASGKAEDALRFEEVRAKLHGRAMLTDEALVALDACDALHALGRDADILALASEIIGTFTDAGMLTAALAAFAYLKEAAENERMSPAVIEHVRTFMTQLQREPTLLFCPPPENL